MAVELNVMVVELNVMIRELRAVAQVVKIKMNCVLLRHKFD